MQTTQLQTRPGPALVFAPFSSDELSALRRLARQPDGFQALAQAAMRLQVLRTFRGASLDVEAGAGAARAEDAALAALGRCHCPDRAGLRLKTDLFASRLVRCDNLAVMFAASLAADAARLDAEEVASREPSRPSRSHAAFPPSKFDGRRSLGPG